MIFLHISSLVYFHACLGVSSSVPAISQKKFKHLQGTRNYSDENQDLYLGKIESLAMQLVTYEGNFFFF